MNPRFRFPIRHAWPAFLIGCLLPFCGHATAQAVALPGDDLEGKIVHRPFDPEHPCAVSIGVESITTITFPDNIAGIDGSGFADSPENARRSNAGFLLAHRAGTRYLTILALKHGVKGTLNVQVGPTLLLTLYCVEGPNSPWRVVLDAPGGEGAAGVTPQPTVESGPAPEVAKSELIDALGHFRELLQGQGGSAVMADAKGQPLPSAEPSTEGRCGTVTTKIVRVVRDNEHDTLFFAVEIRNDGREPYCYDPEGFGVQLPSGEALPQSASLANGLLAAGSKETVFFTITGRPDQRRNNLPPSAAFVVAAHAIHFEPVKVAARPAKETKPVAAQKASEAKPAAPALKSAAKTLPSKSEHRPQPTAGAVAVVTAR